MHCHTHLHTEKKKYLKKYSSLFVALIVVDSIKHVQDLRKQQLRHSFTQSKFFKRCIALIKFWIKFCKVARGKSRVIPCNQLYHSNPFLNVLVLWEKDNLVYKLDAYLMPWIPSLFHFVGITSIWNPSVGLFEAPVMSQWLMDRILI